MNLSVFWRLRDLISPAVQQVVRSARHAQEVMARANQSMQRGWRDSGETINSLRKKIQDLETARNAMRIGVDTRQIQAANVQIDRLNRQLDNLEGRGRRAEGRGGWLGGLLPKGVGVGLGLSAAVAGFGNFAQMGMDREMVTKKFEQFTKSQQMALTMVNDLNRYADATPYLNEPILNIGAKLAMKFSPNEVMDKVKMLGDIAGGDAGRMESIQLALGQIKAKGVLHGSEFNQIAEAQVPILDYLAKIKNVGVDKIAKLTEDRKISYNDVEAALKKMTSEGGIFFGFMDKLANTTQGKWSTLVGTIRNKFTDLSMAQGGWINQAIDWANRFLTSMQPIETALVGLWKAFTPVFSAIRDLLIHLGLINPAGDSVQQIVSLITNVINIMATAVHWAGGMLQWLVGVFQAIPFSKYIGQFLLLNLALKSIGVFSLITSLTKLTGVFDLVGKAWLALNKVFVFSQVGLIITAVVALAAALYYAWNESAKFREVVFGMWGGLQAVWAYVVEVFSGIWQSIKSVLDAIWFAVKFTVRLIAAPWIWLIGLIQQLWGGLVEWFRTSTFGQTILLAIEIIGRAWSGLMENLKAWWDGAKDYMIAGFRVLLGIYTLGLSEVGIAIYKQFNKGYGDTVKNLRTQQQDTAMSSWYDQRDDRSGTYVPKAPSLPKMPTMPSGIGAGSGSGSGGGITDTVEGAKSKSVTINLNKGLIETSNIIVDSKGTGLDIERTVLEQLKRIIMSGEKLALE